MNDYYLLSAFVGNAFKYDNAFKKLFERYFYNKLKASSLPPHTEFVRADVFSDKSGSDFSVSRVNTAVLSDDERQRLATEVIAAVVEEDSSAQAALPPSSAFGNIAAQALNSVISASLTPL